MRSAGRGRSPVIHGCFVHDPDSAPCIPDVLCPVLAFRVFMTCFLLRAKARFPSSVNAQGREAFLFRTVGCGKESGS